jgi:FkbM family methyltransferase
MNSLQLHDIQINYGSLMDIDDRLGFLSSFNGEGYKEFSSFLRHSSGKKTFLDIGCSYGAFGLAFAKRDSGARAYCFDGSMNAWLALNQTIELNELTNIKCHRALMGDVDGLVGVAYDQHQSLVNANSNLSDLMMQVDTFCELFNVTPDCMKIDTEGCEFKILQGAVDTIKQHTPTLFMEVHPNFLKFHGNTIYNVLDLFNDINYIALDLDGNEIADYKTVLEEEKTDSHRSVWVPKT